MPGNSWIRAGLLAGAVALIGAAGLQIRDHLEPAPKPPAPPPAVETVTVQPGVFEVTRKYAGSLEARRRAVISTRISGLLQELYYREGEFVPAGVPVARLDAAELRREVGRLEAALGRTRADLRFWREQLRRDERLFAEGHIPQRNRDESARQAASLTAALTEQKEALDAARIRLGYAELSAPFAGRIQRVEAEPGELLMPGHPLIELVGEGELKAVFPIPQADLATISPGAPTRVSVPGSGTFDGTIARVHPALDPVTRNATFEVDIPSGMQWRPGAQAHAVVLHERHEEAVSIPTHALVEVNGSTGVFLLDEPGPSVRWTPVSAGPSGQGRTVVEGLQTGVRVVVTPHPGLRDGAAVTVNNQWRAAR